MKKVIVIIICSLLIIVGIGVMLYPFFCKKDVEKKQNVLMDQLDKQIENNKKNNNVSANKGGTTNNSKVIDGGYDEKKALESLKQLEVEENESVLDDKKIDLSKQKVIGKIKIEKIGIEFAIVEGSGRSNLAMAIGHMTGTSCIGGTGNCVLAGHHGGIYGEFFKNIDKLEEKDRVVLTDTNGNEYTYEMYEAFKVKPTDVYVANNMEGRILTLITCMDNGKTRLIVRCKSL